MAVVVSKPDDLTHQEIVKPCLHVLGGSAFEIANEEMIAGLGHLRRGRYEDCIVSVTAAYESVLKTILSAKGWSYDADRDSCSTLIKRCRENDLFPPFYESVLASTATIRNKLSRAHGRGPVRLHPDTRREHAEHLLHTTASHILFLVKCAEL